MVLLTPFTLSPVLIDMFEGLCFGKHMVKVRQTLKKTRNLIELLLNAVSCCNCCFACVGFAVIVAIVVVVV